MTYEELQKFNLIQLNFQNDLRGDSEQKRWQIRVEDQYWPQVSLQHVFNQGPDQYQYQ